MDADAMALRRVALIVLCTSFSFGSTAPCPCASACEAAGCADPCCPCTPGTCNCQCKPYAAGPRYLLFTRPPGSATVTPEFLKQVEAGIGAFSSPSGDLLVGNEIIFSLLDGPLDASLQALDAVLNASRASGVPVSLVLDGENWWGTQAQLWNWFNPAAPGYSPENANNVEWFGRTNASAVKIGWRNWGSQIRVTPQQNMLSPAVLAALQPRLAAMAGKIAAWYQSLPAGLKYLLACVKVGWEAGVQYNAYYYGGGNDLVGKPASEDPTYGMDWSKGVSGGLPLLGYAAAITSGMLKDGQELTSDVIARVTAKYLSWLAGEVVAAGVPDDKVVNHAGGQQPDPSGEPVVAYAAGFSSVGVPGYSLYWGTPSAAFLQEMKVSGRTRWAAAEWNLRGRDENEWYDDFLGTLSVLDCAHIAVYNWDNDFEHSDSGKAAVRRLLAGWRAGSEGGTQQIVL